MSVNRGFDWDKSINSNERGSGRKLGRRGYGSMPRSPSETLEPMRAAEPPIIHRKKREYHQTIVFMSGTLTTIVLLFIGVGLMFGFAKYLYDKQGPLDHSDVISIPRGEGLTAIANRLERKNIIIDKRLFKAAVIYFGVQNKLKAGEYEIPKNASMRAVIDRLIEGKSIMHTLSFPEGMTSQQLVNRIIAHEVLTGEVVEIPAEGSLLPDTYRFARNTNRSELIKRMQSAQDSFIESHWQQRKEGLPVKTKEEALILASIVEKETGIAGERPHIAGVFMNRLNQGMRLQSDPTIIYGLVGGVGKLGRGLFRSEIDKETPYNTYKINGLPPTPIANPGRAAIEAVLNPKETDDIYFVADGSGGHIFAKTLKEHEYNVKNWRVIEKERKEQAEIERKLNAEKAAQDLKDGIIKDDDVEAKSTSSENDKSNNIFDNLDTTNENSVALKVPNKVDSEPSETSNNEALHIADIPLPLKK